MKTIAWDIDDVLNDLMRVWFEEFWKPSHPDCKLSYQDLKENMPHELLNVKQEEYLASLDDFRFSGRYAKLEPNSDIKDWFIAHGHKCRHFALTRVPVAVAHVSAGWLMKNFGNWIRSFHFIPSYRAGENPAMYDENKGAYLHYFGKADLLIDDTLENIEAAEKAGVRSLVYPRPWNRSKMTIDQLLDETLKIIEGK